MHCECGQCCLAQPGKNRRDARRQSVTALALAADDCTAFSVSKDGSIVQLDVETCKRCRPCFATLSVIVNSW